MTDIQTAEIGEIKMKQIRKSAIILLPVLCLLCGCGRQEPAVNLQSIDISEIDKIKCSGTNGTQHGNFSYYLSEDECSEFIDLLHQTELGNEINEKDALTSGAVTYYTLYFSDGNSVTISPSPYFKIENAYYEFTNYDDLWNQFIEFNSNR